MRSAQLSAFIAKHRLPESFARLVATHYSRVCDWLLDRLQAGTPFLLGVNGAQGTGKSTLADYLQAALAAEHGLRVAVLSLDDFYLGHAERRQLAAAVHPLLATRGVPGTHDIAMLKDCLAALRGLDAASTLALPRFDKARDDRAPRTVWPEVAGPIDLIIFEGWCVGSRAQSDDELSSPVNALEEQHDAAGDWRRYVNEQLRTQYADVFDDIDALVFLRAPGFDAVHRWRLEQEQKLAARTTGNPSKLMDSTQLTRFIQHYERITRANLETLPGRADVVLWLGDDHGCVRTEFRSA